MENWRVQGTGGLEGSGHWGMGGLGALGDGRAWDIGGWEGSGHWKIGEKDEAPGTLWVKGRVA